MSKTLATYRLQFPIVRETRDPEGVVNEEELRPAGFCVVIRRPRAKDLRIMDDFGEREIDGVKYAARELAGSIALLARVSNLSDEEAELLDAVDLGELGNLLGGVSGRGQTTGETV